MTGFFSIVKSTAFKVSVSARATYEFAVSKLKQVAGIETEHKDFRDYLESEKYKAVRDVVDDYNHSQLLPEMLQIKTQKLLSKKYQYILNTGIKYGDGTFSTPEKYSVLSDKRLSQDEVEERILSTILRRSDKYGKDVVGLLDFRVDAERVREEI